MKQNIIKQIRIKKTDTGDESENLINTKHKKHKNTIKTEHG